MATRSLQAVISGKVLHGPAVQQALDRLHGGGGLQGGAQAHDGLGADLGGAGFGDSQHGADFLQVQLRLEHLVQNEPDNKEAIQKRVDYLEKLFDRFEEAEKRFWQKLQENK